MRFGAADRLAFALVLGAAAVALLGFAARAQPLANKDYCANDGTNVMFVIDVTTEYDPKDKELLVRAVGDINSRYTAANAAIVTQKTARGWALDEEDKFALPRLDRLLRAVRAKADFGIADGGGAEGSGAGGADQRPPPLDALVQAHSNVTRVPLRDQK